MSRKVQGGRKEQRGRRSDEEEGATRRKDQLGRGGGNTYIQLHLNDDLSDLWRYLLLQTGQPGKHKSHLHIAVLSRPDFIKNYSKAQSATLIDRES